MMSHTASLTAAALSAALLLGGPLPGSGTAHAQESPLAMNTTSSGSSSEGGESLSALERGRFAVVIDLDTNKLHFQQGETTLWSATIGTGTGLRLEADDADWDFRTPNGTFHVKYKEVDPVWIAPDWYFIENGLPVPPANDKKRNFPGGLGAAAVYIGHDLAIHGTDKPELLGQRVSHGCIRMSDRDARRLYHNVQIGTEVIIRGGQKAYRNQRTVTPAEARKLATPKKPRGKQPKDPVTTRWEKLDTPELLTELNVELWRDADQSRWPEVAGMLLERGLDKDDERALEGLLAGVVDLPSRRVEREYGTFLADAYGRGAMRTMKALAELAPSQRRRAAEAIVDATMMLSAGDWAAPSAPWPTQRVPRSAVDYEARRGWNALAAAEAEYRDLQERTSS